MKIGEREIPMMLSTAELIDIQEEIGCTVGQLRDEVVGVEINFETEEVKFGVVSDPEKLKKFAKLIRIMGNAGLKNAGEEPDLTDEWLMDNMDPHALLAYQVAVIGFMSKETESQAAAEEKQDEARDVVLDEINAKKEPVNSPTGE